MRLTVCSIVFHFHGFFKKVPSSLSQRLHKKVHPAFNSLGVGKTIEAIADLNMPRLHAGDSRLRVTGACSFL